MKLSTEEILALQDLTLFSPHESLQILALLFETGREKAKLQYISKGIDLAEGEDLKKFDLDHKMIFHFNMANGWLYKQQLTEDINSDNFWGFKGPELEMQIIHLRLAYTYSKNSKDTFNRCQIMTNLGNCLSHIGRFSEAQFYWKKVIEINPKFSMGVGNVGFGLFHYARVLYDEGQQVVFLKLAYLYLNKAIGSNDLYPEAQEAFHSVTQHIVGMFKSPDEVHQTPDFKAFSLGRSADEQDYRKWCLGKQLFLNPLNDLTTENIASHDCLYLPSITVSINQSKVFQSIFNQIKQEYVSARYLLYQGLQYHPNHFSDDGNLLMDTLDYPLYSYSLEQIKIAYRTMYSTLDKISYFLNEYLELKKDPNRVNFRNVWTKKNKKLKNFEIHPKIASSKNWPLRGLYWLSRDFYEKDQNFLQAIEPEAQSLAEIRQFLEHKALTVIEYPQIEKSSDLVYCIEKQDFELKTLKITRLVRSAIIYLSLSIHLEEGKKISNNSTIPLNFIRYNY